MTHDNGASVQLIEDAKEDGCVFYDWPVKREATDPLIWPAVERINQSGWVATGESCQGHPDHGAVEAIHTAWDHNTRPYLRLIVRQDNYGEMLARLMRAFESIAEEERFERGWGQYPPSIALYHEERRDFAEVKAYITAHNVLLRDLGCRLFKEFGDLLCQWSPEANG